MFENINLVRKLAWSFHNTTGIEWKELFSQACLAYVEAMQSYDHTKGAKTTWAYHGVQNDLINFCKREHRFSKISRHGYMGEWDDPSKVKMINGIEEWYSNSSDVYRELFTTDKKLSRDTEEILEMAIQDPNRYALPPRKAIGRIRKDLREIKKWTWPRIEAAMRNLREELQEEPNLS